MRLNTIIAYLTGVSTIFTIELVDGFYLTYILSLSMLMYLRINYYLLFSYVVFSILVLMSSLFNSSDSIFAPIVTIYTLLFLTAELSRDYPFQYFIRGFKFGIMLAFSLFCYAVFDYGYLDLYELFIRNRSWFKEILPFAGNGLAIILSLGIFLLHSNSKLRYFALITAVMTTSRLALLSVVSLYERYAKLAIFSLFIFILLISIFFIENLSWLIDNPFAQRIIKSEDRIITYQDNFDAFLQSPVLGNGATDIGYYKHAHNSFLYILARHGLFAFLIYLSLITIFLMKLFRSSGSVVVFILLLCSLTQIALQNIAVVMILAVIVRNHLNPLHDINTGKKNEAV